MESLVLFSKDIIFAQFSATLVARKRSKALIVRENNLGIFDILE
jgi:hypothetical protein